VSKVKTDATKGNNSCRSLNAINKVKAVETGKMSDFRKQIYASLIPKVEFDVIAQDDGDSSVNLSSGTKSSLPRPTYKNSKSIFEK